MKIRGVTAGDLGACYAISLATGLAGGDASHLYRDPRTMGDIYVAPYVLLESRLAFVVEDREGIAGFVAGAEDTAAWEARLESEWWPSLRTRYSDPSNVVPEERTPDQRRAWMIHHPARTPSAVVACRRRLIPRASAHEPLTSPAAPRRRGKSARPLARSCRAARHRGIPCRRKSGKPRGHRILARIRLRAAIVRRPGRRSHAVDGALGTLAGWRQRSSKGVVGIGIFGSYAASGTGTRAGSEEP